MIAMKKAPKPAAGKKPETTDRQTAASIRHVAGQLEAMTASLHASVAGMEGTPAIPAVDVRYSRSLSDGLRMVRLWVDEVRDVVDDAKLTAITSNRLE